MKTIKLTKGKVALVDDEDYERLNQYKWHAAQDREIWYAKRKSAKISGKQKTITMHREIMNATKGVQVDHRNGDGLYNQKTNLRFCTHQQNQQNRKNPQKNNKLGIKGVRWDRNAKKFQARITIKGKQLYLGLFTVLADADQAYRVAEIKYFGEFAREETKKLYSC